MTKVRSALVLVLLSGGAILLPPVAYVKAADAPAASAAVPAQPDRKVLYWYDPMKPDAHFDRPGKSPFMDMQLVPKYAEAGPVPERRVLYWYDPMNPQAHFDRPGKSPSMDMPLEPKYADDGGPATSVAVAPGLVQTLGLRTAKVERGGAGAQVRSVGSVAFDEHRIVAVEARAPGWVESLAVRAVGDPLRRGQVIAGIYSPDLLAAQQELALAVKSGDAGLVAASRERLSLLGVPAGAIDAIARGGSPARRVAVAAPTGGIVTELNVREGMQVSPGMPLLRIADLSRVWVNVQLPEAQSAVVKQGAAVRLTAAALPGRNLQGTIDYVYPDLDAATRTLRARIALDNPGLALRPGMYVEALLGAAGNEAGNELSVPTEAVIRTGTRTVVIVVDGDGRYHPVKVAPGAEQGERTVILAGLEEGQTVVTSGQFLIDSEASLRGAYDRMGNP